LVKIISTVLAVLMLGTMVAGCSGALGEEGARDLALQAVANYDQLRYLKFDITMPVAMSVTGGAQAGTGSITVQSNGSVDNASRSLHMGNKISLTSAGSSDYQVPSDTYVMGNWAYMALTYTDGSQQWMKSQITPDMWVLQNSLNEPVNLMRSSTSFQSVGEEKIGSADCAIIEVQPTRDVLGQWLDEQQVLDMSSTTWSEADLPTVVKQASYKFWVDQKTKQIMKMQIDLTLEATPIDVKAKSTDFTLLTYKVSATILVYDFNVPFNLLLPDGAKTAVDLNATAGQ
jgi:hypothetical protein